MQGISNVIRIGRARWVNPDHITHFEVMPKQVASDWEGGAMKTETPGDVLRIYLDVLGRGEVYGQVCLDVEPDFAAHFLEKFNLYAAQGFRYNW